MNSPPAPTGLLSDVPLVALLADAARRKLTGSLEVRTGEERLGTIVLAEGAIAKARARDPVALLGQLAVGYGFITNDALDAALAEQESTREPLGHRLLARGALTPTMLGRLLAEQAALKCAHICLADGHATYTFTPDADLLAIAVPSDGPRVDVRAAIWRGIEANPPWTHVREVLTPFENAPIELSAATNLLRYGLDASEQACAECLRVRPMSLADLRAALIVPPSTATLLVYALWLMGQISSRRAPMHAAQLALSTPRLGATPAAPFAAWSSRRVMTTPSASFAPLPPPPSRKSAPPLAPPPSSRAPTSSRPAPRHSGAVPVARRASSPSHPALPVATRAYLEAENALRARKLDQAIAIADSLGDGPDARALAAFVDAHVKPTETGILASIERLEVLLTDDAGSARAFQYRGLLRLRLGDEPGAMKDLERAVKLDPTLSSAEDRLRVLSLRASGKHRLDTTASSAPKRTRRPG